MSPVLWYNRYALTGIPVLFGPGRACGELTDADFDGYDVCKTSSAALDGIRRRMDARCGGRLPVLMESPALCLVLPRMSPDGALRSVAFVNARIDVQKPVRVRLRGVPPGAKFATWWALRESPVFVPVVRRGADAEATVPAIAPWNCGWLQID